MSLIHLYQIILLQCGLLAVVFVCKVTVTAASNPALRARLTKNGVDNIVATAKKLLKELVGKYSTLPEFKTEFDGTTLELKPNGRISNFIVPNLALTLAPPNVVIVSSAGGHIQLDAKVSARREKVADFFLLDQFPVSIGIDLHAKLNNLKFAITMKLEVTANGHIHLALEECQADVRGVIQLVVDDILFGFDVTGLVEAFIDEPLKMMNHEMCKQLPVILKNTVNAELLKLKQSFDLPEGFRLNYDFAAQPQVTEQMVDFLFGVSVQHKDEPSVAVSASPLPSTDEHDKDFYIWAAAANIANALAKLAQQKGILKYKLDSKSQPEAAQFLHTGGCFICVGGLLSGLPQKYPNTSVYLDLATLQAPAFSVVQDKATISLVGGMQMRSEQPPGELIIDAELTVDITVSVELKTDDSQTIRPHGQFTIDRVQVRSFTSNIGSVTEKQQLQSVLDFFSPSVAGAISHRLNTLALPSIPALQLLEPELKLLPGFIEIATSVYFFSNDLFWVLNRVIDPAVMVSDGSMGGGGGW